MPSFGMLLVLYTLYFWISCMPHVFNTNWQESFRDIKTMFMGHKSLWAYVLSNKQQNAILGVMGLCYQGSYHTLGAVNWKYNVPKQSVMIHMTWRKDRGHDEKKPRLVAGRKQETKRSPMSKSHTWPIHCSAILLPTFIPDRQQWWFTWQEK